MLPNTYFWYNFSIEIYELINTDSELGIIFPALEECSVDQLERTGNKLLESVMRKPYEAKTIVESVASLITRTDKKYETGTGLFIDWLVQIEPEIIGSSLELQVCKDPTLIARNLSTVPKIRSQFISS